MNDESLVSRARIHNKHLYRIIYYNNIMPRCLFIMQKFDKHNKTADPKRNT